MDPPDSETTARKELKRKIVVQMHSSKGKESRDSSVAGEIGS